MYLFFREFVKICGEQVIKRKNEQRRKKKTKVFLKNNFIPFWIDFRLVHGLYKRGVINPFFIFGGKKQVCKVNYGHYIIFRIENYHVEKQIKKFWHGKLIVEKLSHIF